MLRPLNFNLLSEIGFALGFGVPVLPIRDTSNIRDVKDFEELGILDTFGYFDYRNAIELRDGVLSQAAAPLYASQMPAIKPMLNGGSESGKSGLLLSAYLGGSRPGLRSYLARHLSGGAVRFRGRKHGYIRLGDANLRNGIG